MERLKSAVPADVRRAVGEGTTRDLPTTTSLLLAFFDGLPLFHQVIGELTDPELALRRKDKGRAAELKGRGNACFSRREFDQALGFYSQILEKLYHPKHIAIAHELIKLVTIELSLGDRASAAATFAQAEAIFSLYYGPDVQRILPYVDALKRTVSGGFIGEP